MPDFPGGEDALAAYLGKNIKYPKQANEAGIQGRVVLNFVVNEDGDISDIKVARGIGYGCDQEAMRVVNSMPKWKPGKQNGKAVKVSFSLPIMFQLEE
jgi:protein TonB